jgi:hypothetical protein
MGKQMFIHLAIDIITCINKCSFIVSNEIYNLLNKLKLLVSFNLSS